MSPEYHAPNQTPSSPSKLRGLLLLLLVGITVGGYALARNQDQPKSGETGAATETDSGAETTVKPGDEEKPSGEEPAETKKEPENPFPNRIKAPSLEGGSEWLNVAGEISLKDLRGKVVLLDFWTYCCINCLHVLPDLKYLEQKYDKELVVIGVHSAKFDNEKESGNIRKAILRYEIEHPVINDSKMVVWQKFGARAWPTIVMLDPEGHYCGYISGEGNREILDQIVGKVVEYHKFKGTLDETPFKFDLERNKTKPTPLKFPGKILADEKNDRLFISDSNHNRIVISSLDGKLQEVIGTGEIGLKDGSYTEAQFDHPQGMALVDNTLYVADTENHSIRTVDLEKKTVSTLAGTGEQARRRVLSGPTDTTALNSPWALHVHEGVLYIAMAGPHQMWAHKIGSERIEVYAGSGREDIIDGPLDTAAMAQPSGIAADDKFMYVCDSEGSSIRKIPFDPDAEMTTVVGAANLPRGRSLFEFGDVDGKGEEARLQHPLGIVHANGTLYVADTYNHKIKKIDLAIRESKTWLGTGTAGAKLDPVEFYEPSGLALVGEKLYIADTNNHRLCVADLKTEKVTEFKVEGLKPPELKETTEEIPALSADATKQDTVQGKAGGNLTIEIALELPEGFKLNKLLPMTYVLTTANKQQVIAADQLNKRRRANANEETKTVTLTIPLADTPGKAELQLSLAYGYCNEGTGGLCKLNRSQWVIPVETTANGPAKALKLKSVAK